MKLKFRADKKDIVIFIIFCVFLLYLVAILIININSFATRGEFIGLNPLPAFMPEFLLTTIVFYVLALVAVLASCSSYFFEREKGFGVTTKKKSKNDGYTKLWEEKDMKKDYGIAKIVLTDDVYEAGGFPVINNGKEAWVDNGENHSLIMGASGSGKSQSFMKPLIRILGRHGESMIVTDPKGELYESCGNLLKEKGYKIILLNFRDPAQGSAWNPFTYPYSLYKEGNVDKANELLQDLAGNILKDVNNSNADPFWQETAANFFTGLSLGLFDDAKEEEININSINMMAEVGADRIGSSTYWKEYFKSKGELSPASIAASSCIKAPSETQGGIMSTFRTKTRIFSSQKALSEMLSYSDFDMRDIGKEKTAVFLKVHDEKTTYHALATIFVKQVYEALIAVAQTCPNLKLPFRTNFVLDEFANMPALKDVESMITASRSRNIRFNFVIQNFSQLNKVYGKDVAETIKGNCGNFVYLMSTELAALEEISKLLGEKKPDKADKDKPQQPIRPLFTVSDLQALKEGEVIINRFRSMPFKTKLTYDWKIDWGTKYPDMGYHVREPREVQIFDIKEYVHKLREEQGMSANFNEGPHGFKNPFVNPSFIPPMGGGMSSLSNIDEYIKSLDKQIAELEAEEEKKKEHEKLQKEIDDILDIKSKDIANIENNEYIEPTTINKTEITTPKEIVNIDDIKPLDEKSKVNIDVDSVVVKNNIPDDDFFDDFFGNDE